MTWLKIFSSRFTSLCSGHPAVEIVYELNFRVYVTSSPYIMVLRNPEECYLRDISKNVMHLDIRHWLEMNLHSCEFKRNVRFRRIYLGIVCMQVISEFALSFCIDSLKTVLTILCSPSKKCDICRQSPCVSIKKVV